MGVGLAARAGQPVGVEKPDELVIAGVLVHEVDDREVHRDVSGELSGACLGVLANPGASLTDCLTEFASRASRRSRGSLSTSRGPWSWPMGSRPGGEPEGPPPDRLLGLRRQFLGTAPCPSPGPAG